MSGEYMDFDLALPDFTEVLSEAEKVIRECFKLYKLEEVFLAFNGGKDCTVLLDITINILKQMHNIEDIKNKFKVLYIRTDCPFEEVETFAADLQKHYGVKLTISEGAMIDTLNKLLEGDKRLQACLMGTRRTDPYSNQLNFMQKTDPNWPQMMRVSPLLNWSYHHIWSYILHRKVPYCKLYNKGYTSLGNIHNTWPNPSLAYRGAKGETLYNPAWRLTDESLERAGRGNKPMNGYHSVDPPEQQT